MGSAFVRIGAPLGLWPVTSPLEVTTRVHRLTYWCGDFPSRPGFQDRGTQASPWVWPAAPARARPRPWLRRGDLGDFPCAGVPGPVHDSGSDRAPPRAPGRARPSPLQPQVGIRILRRSLPPGPCGSLCSRVAVMASILGRGLPSVAGRGLVPAPVTPPGRSLTHTPSPRGLTASVVPGPCMECPARDVRADGRPEPYLVSIDTLPPPYSDWGMGAPAFARAARFRARYTREGWPSRPPPTCATAGHFWPPLIGSGCMRLTPALARAYVFKRAASPWTGSSRSVSWLAALADSELPGPWARSPPAWA